MFSLSKRELAKNQQQQMLCFQLTHIVQKLGLAYNKFCYYDNLVKTVKYFGKQHFQLTSILSNELPQKTTLNKPKQAHFYVLNYWL